MKTKPYGSAQLQHGVNYRHGSCGPLHWGRIEVHFYQLFWDALRSGNNKPVRIIVWLILASGLVTLVLLLFVCPPGDQSADGNLQTGQASLIDESAVQAQIELIEQRLQSALEHGRELDSLIRDLQELINHYPQLARPRTLLAHMLLLIGDQERAYAVFLEVLKLEPNQPEVQLNAGTAATQIGKLEEAQRHYSAAVRLNPANGRFRLHLAQVYIQRGLYDKARRTLVQSLQVDSSLHRAHALLSDVMAKQNKIGAALDQIHRALEIVGRDKKDSQIQYIQKRAYLLRRNNQPEMALEVLREMVRQAPEETLLDLRVAQEMAACWSMMGEPEKAASYYENLLALDPVNDLAAARAVHWFIRAGDLDSAVRNVDLLRNINPRFEALPRLQQEIRYRATQSGAPNQ